MCGSTSGSVWQCARRQCAAVRLVVYGSARGSVRLSGSAAVCSSVRQCARLLVCDSVRGGVRQCVGLCVAMFGSKHGSVRAMHAVQLLVCGSAWQCVAVPAHGAVSVWQCALRIYTQSRSQYTFPYRGGGNEPNIPRILIFFSQN